MQVEVIGLYPDQVAAALRYDHVAELATQARYVYLEGFGGGGGRIVAPKVVNQTFARDDFAVVEQQDREHRLKLAPSYRDLPTMVADRERSKNAEFHS